MMNKTEKNDNDAGVAKRLKNLIEAGHYLADIESIGELFPRLLELAKGVTVAEASSLLLYNPERDVLVFQSIEDEVIGKNGADLLKGAIELQVGEGIAGWVAENRKSLIVPDAHRDKRFSNKADMRTGFHTRNILSVPLIYDQELLGVINTVNSKGKACFDLEDQEILESFSQLASVAIIRSRLLETRLKQQKMEVQLSAAAKIQALFWPELPALKAGSHVWAVSEPAAFVGGDVYDLIPMADGSWVIYVADVSDKGLPAALIMAALWTRIRSEAPLYNLDMLVNEVNRSMYELMSEEGFFATMIICRYWPLKGRLQLIRAGHLQPLWLRNDGLGLLPDLKGLSIGVKPDTSYEKNEIVLSPGESILFLTDGVTDAENEQAELFGEKRVKKFVTNPDGPPVGKKLLEYVKTWQGKRSAADDLTMLEIWRDSP
ncbi:PP2C family protein-serine/threonine phosphatase [Thermodesulfobacteriota bacterium]